MKGHRSVSHLAAAANARRQAGRWVRAGEYTSRASGVASAFHARSAQLSAYRPAGAFQAVSYRESCGYVLWVRYVGGTQPQPSVPRTMTVRVLRSGVQGLEAVQVVISTRCPAAGCGAPRGWDTVRPVPEGHGLEVDTWTNACGHVDTPVAVLAECSPGEAAPVQIPSPMPDVVRLLVQATGERRIRHGGQAARLLAEYGYDDEAALIQGQVRSARGRYSAQQALSYLCDLVTAATPTRKDCL